MELNKETVPSCALHTPVEVVCGWHTFRLGAPVNTVALVD